VTTKSTKLSKGIVGILGAGEIGSAIASIAKKKNFKVYIRELNYDQIKTQPIDFLHVNIPEKSPNKFVSIVSKNILEINPTLTIINSSTTPGTTRKIYKRTLLPIVHSPVIGLHPRLENSIKNYFPKIIGPVNKKSETLAAKHLKDLGLKVEIYSSSEDSEAAKLFDLVYYAWNIVYCKMMFKACKDLNLNFEDVYTRHNQIYNKGYTKLQPNITRPVMIPHPGPIAGHCTIPDTIMIDKYYNNSLTKFILKENKIFHSEVKDLKKARKEYIKLRESSLVKK